MKKLITRKCPRCRKKVEFEVRKGKNNLKIICQECGLKTYVKRDEEIKEDIGFYFPYKFEKSARRKK